jgi:hypothetical protein
MSEDRILLCPALSGPREAPANHVESPLQRGSPGGFRIEREAFLRGVHTQVTELIWEVCGRDRRESADLLEEIAARLQEESDSDRRQARIKPKQRGEKALLEELE